VRQQSVTRPQTLSSTADERMLLFLNTTHTAIHMVCTEQHWPLIQSTNNKAPLLRALSRFSRVLRPDSCSTLNQRPCLQCLQRAALAATPATAAVTAAAVVATPQLLGPLSAATTRTPWIHNSMAAAAMQRPPLLLHHVHSKLHSILSQIAPSTSTAKAPTTAQG
jgi:hypothetical protein